MEKFITKITAVFAVAVMAATAVMTVSVGWLTSFAETAALTDSLDVQPWHDDYSLKSEDLTIWFTLSNHTGNYIKDPSDEIFDIYEKKDDEWVKVAHPVTIDRTPSEKMLRPGERTVVEFPLGIYYSRNKIKPGIYALNIPGHGFAEFRLTDKEPDYSSIPYAKLSERNIEKVTVSEYDCGADDARQTELTHSDALKIVRCLKQTVIGENAEEAFSGLVGMSGMEVNIKYEDGSEETAVFRNSDMISYNDTVVWCGKCPYTAIRDILYKALNDLEEDDIRYEKRSGWFKLDGVKRRYNKGLPYTGWLKNKDGSRKYCLDGYLMTGEFQIGKYIYSFGEDGIYTGNKTLSPLTGSCGKVSVDADEAEILVTLNDKSGKKYGVASPYTIERWQNGSWINWTDEENLKEYSDVILSKDKKTGSVYFYPGWFTYHAFSAGYYRVTLPVRVDGSSGAGQDLYVVFEAVLPVQVRTSQDVYKIDKGDDIPDIEVRANIDINSEKLDKNEIEKMTVRIDKDLGGIWENVVSAVPYTEYCDSVDSYGNISLCINCPPEPGNYILVVTVGYSSYYCTFRVESN